MSYSRSNTGIKFNSSTGSIARLSTLRKSFLSPVSEAVSAASAKSASISYLTPTEAAYLRTTSIRAPSSSSSSSSNGSVSASLSTSLSSTKSSSTKTKSSSRISDMTTTTGSSQTGSYGYDIASLTSSPSRSPASVISPSESSPTVSSSTQRSDNNGPTVMSASAAASVAASMAASVAAASIAVASARASNSSNKSLNSFMRESAKLNGSPCACHSSSSSSQSKSSKNSYNKPASYMSKIEASILRSSEPIPICETQEIIAAGNRGIFANRCEVCTWKGDLPINEYPINEDACPNVINKRLKQKLEYVQEMAIRYLKPPTPPAPGEIIIKQEPNRPVAPAPPIVIRQQPPRPCTPEPLVIREAPPPPPPMCGRKVITISGKQLPAPPRKVVIERMPPIPSKPQSVVIERWLPYTEQKRRVIFQKAPPDPVVCKPKNIIVQWEAPEVCIKKDIRHLGVIRANPCEYVQKYGCSLKQPCDLPQFVRDIKPQCGIELAANKPYNPIHELEGDVCALKYVNLECEGLNIYKEQVKEKCEKKACGLCATQASSARVVASHRSSPKYANHRYSNSAIKFGASPASVRSSASDSSNSNDKNHNTSGSSSGNENDAVNASYGSSFSSNSSSGCGDCEARFSYTISTTEEVVSPTCSPVVSSPAKFM